MKWESRKEWTIESETAMLGVSILFWRKWKNRKQGWNEISG